MASFNTFIAFLDIGHGNCTVVFDRGSSCLVDCGPGSYALEFLTNEGITIIENVFLSHADEDHIRGLVAIFSANGITINNVYVNSDGIKESRLWEELTYTLSKSSVNGGTKFHPAITRTQGDFKCGDLIIETIGPSPYLAAKSPGGKDHFSRVITSNSISASFRICNNGQPLAYLAGDIDEIGLDDIKDHGLAINAPLLVFPHHGGNINGKDLVSFTEELCDLTACDTVIFSIGRNQHSNPRKEVVETIRNKIKNVRIACTQLSKHCAQSPNNIMPIHLNEVFSRGRIKNECCSGTFIISISDTVKYYPDINSHLAFIQASAITPLCLMRQKA